MSQIILIEPNKNLREILSLNLQTYVGASIIVRDSAVDAMELMRILPGIDLIITRNFIENEKTAESLIYFLNENENDTAIIVLGSFQHELKSHYVNIKDHLNWQETVKRSTKILGVDEEALKAKVVPEFIPIPLHYFLPIETTACDIFIRIKKSAEDFQYVKRIHAGDKFSKQMVHKYVQQGLAFFYIPKNSAEQFTNHVSDQLVNKLEQVNIGTESHLIILAESHTIALQEIKKWGFNSATVQLTEAIIDNMLKTADESPEMSQMLKKIVNTKSGYLYQHSHMTSLIAGEIVKFLNVDNSHHVRVVSYAALFKDIYLVDHPELAKISTFSELEELELSDEDWDLVFNHAFDASVIIKNNAEAPEGIEEVLKTHHGSQNGKGFSITHAEKLPTLQQIFIVSCEFVKEILLFKEKGGTPTPVIKSLYAKFQGEEVIKIIKSLEKVLLNLKRKN